MYWYDANAFAASLAVLDLLGSNEQFPWRTPDHPQPVHEPPVPSCLADGAVRLWDDPARHPEAGPDARVSRQRGAARFLFAMPPKRKKVWTEADLDPATAGRYARLLRGLHALDFASDAKDRPVPIILQFTAAARQQFIEFFGEWAEKQYHAQGDLAAALSKLEGYAIRFALIHHCAVRAALDNADPLDRTPVREESLEAGIALARWFADECERVYQMLSETEEEANCRLLVEYLGARGGRTVAG
jgi:hypothetical protein